MDFIQIKLDKNNKAEGIYYLHHGVKKYARVSKEIIVSGGSIDSPKLLMLSSIGPKEHLDSIGVGILMMTFNQIKCFDVTIASRQFVKIMYCTYVYYA